MDVIEVVQTIASVEVVAAPTTVVEVAAAVGPPGPQGPSGIGSYVHAQTVPLATWTIPHTLGRMPSVSLYDSLGEQVEADVTASPTAATASYPSPRTGTAVLT